MVEYDEPRAMELLRAVVDLMVAPSTWSSTINAAFAPLATLPLDVAQRVVKRIAELAEGRANENQWFAHAFARHSVALEQRQRDALSVESVSRSPEQVLQYFRERSTSRFQVQNTHAGQACNIAILTAIDIESQELVEEIKGRNIRPESFTHRGRYFDIFDLPQWDSRSPVRVVFTQATEKGGQPAAALTADVLRTFRPQLVLLVGVCGGFEEKGVTLYDIIVARQVFSYDPERIQVGGNGLRPQVYRCDEQLLRLVTYRYNRGAFNGILDGSTLHVKDYASGEKVIAWRDAQLRGRILGLSPDLYAVETEAHGVMHSIWEEFKVDQFVGGGVIKCISDLSDAEMAVDKELKQRTAARKAARFALDVASSFRRG
jgi:nucleoside phosphorylase